MTEYFGKTLAEHVQQSVPDSWARHQKICSSSGHSSGAQRAFVEYQHCAASLQQYLQSLGIIMHLLVVDSRSDDFRNTNKRTTADALVNAWAKPSSVLVSDQAEFLYQHLKSRITKHAYEHNPEHHVFGEHALYTSAVSGSDLYLSVYRPSFRADWYGNLRKFHFTGTTGLGVDANGNPVLIECDGKYCLNSGLADLWVPQSRSSTVTRAGAAELQEEPQRRRVFVQTDNGNLQRLQWANRVGEVRSGSVEASLIRNWLRSGRVAHADQALENLQWLMGGDPVRFNTRNETRLLPLSMQPRPKANARQLLGAAVHSEPLIVRYGVNSSNHHAQQDEVVFFADQSGFLRAIEGQSGRTLYTIYFASLLEQVPDRVSLSADRQSYGLDGQWVAWRQDSPDQDGRKDGQIKAADGDFVRLFAGMRRGGRHLLGLDVTDKHQPELLFDIAGGDPSEVTDPFSAMGYTFSTPVLAKARLPGQQTASAIMVVGGGYDPKLSGDPIPQEPCATVDVICGNQLYVLNPGTVDSDKNAGKLITWASASAHADVVVPELQNSLVGDVQLIDINQDSLVDYGYAVDIKGQLIRIKFNHGEAHWFEVKVLAKLGETDRQRFFASPDIAIMRRTSDQKPYIAVAFGSGDLDHPYRTDIVNRVYVYRDEEPFDQGGPNRAFPLTSRDAFQLTGGSQQLDRFEDHSLIAIELGEPGEKLLSQPMIVKGNLFFSTFVPGGRKRTVMNDDQSTGKTECRDPAGQSYLYGLNVQTGTIPELSGLADDLRSGDQWRPIATGLATWAALTPLTAQVNPATNKLLLRSGDNSFEFDVLLDELVRYGWHIQ